MHENHEIFLWPAISRRCAAGKSLGMTAPTKNGNKWLRNTVFWLLHWESNHPKQRKNCPTIHPNDFGWKTHRGGMVFLIVGLVGGFEIHLGGIEPEGRFNSEGKMSLLNNPSRTACLNDVIGTECCHFTQDLVQCIVWQHLTVFSCQESRLSLLLSWHVHSPPAEITPAEHMKTSSSFVISALGGTKDKEAQHLTCLQCSKKNVNLHVKLGALQKVVGVGATSFRCAVIALLCACAHPTTTPQG